MLQLRWIRRPDVVRKDRSRRVYTSSSNNCSLKPPPVVRPHHSPLYGLLGLLRRHIGLNSIFPEQGPRRGPMARVSRNGDANIGQVVPDKFTQETNTHHPVPELKINSGNAKVLTSSIVKRHLKEPRNVPDSHTVTTNLKRDALPGVPRNSEKLVVHLVRCVERKELVERQVLQDECHLVIEVVGNENPLLIVTEEEENSVLGRYAPFINK